MKKKHKANYIGYIKNARGLFIFARNLYIFNCELQTSFHQKMREKKEKDIFSIIIIIININIEQVTE